ncbi:MAG: hypothetical protein PHS57_00035 [Alphaproteobacteria bacterium]|nr:hypothetical protein [Alphaproteobacteria bacterium]
MNDTLYNQTLHWLTSSLGIKRNCLATFCTQMTGIAMKVGTNLSLHKKFMALMGQVAQEKEKETAILDEIEAMEKRHHLLRQKGLLEQRLAAAEEREQRQRKKENLAFQKELDRLQNDGSSSRFNLVGILILLYGFWPRGGSSARRGLFANGGVPLKPREENAKPKVR